MKRAINSVGLNGTRPNPKDAEKFCARPLFVLDTISEAIAFGER